MNREQREQYEQGFLLPSPLSVPTLEGRGKLLLGLFLEPLRGYRGHSLLVRGENLLETLPSLFAIFACFAVRFIADTPF